MFTVDIREKCFAAPHGEGVRVLRDIRFSVQAREFVVLLGASGAGKTTLLNILAGLDSDFEGEVLLQTGRNTSVPKIGFVFQSPCLLPWKTVKENLSLVLGQGDNSEGDRIAEMLCRVGLSDAHDRYANRLSLGMARRVSLARALLFEPDVLLLDEPFVSLDNETRIRMRRALLDAHDSFGANTVMVTHDVSEAVDLADRILVLGGSPSRLVGEFHFKKPREQRTSAWRDEQARIVVNHLA